MTTEQRNGALRLIPIVLSILLGAWSLVSTTLAIARGRDSERQAVQITQILLVIDGMKDVDAALALQMERDRGERTTEIAVIQAQISNIGKLLEEIKLAILGVRR